MKKSIKFLIVFMLIAIMVTSCGNKYIDTVSAHDLAVSGLATFTTEGGTKWLDDDIILEFVDEKPSYLVDYSVVKANNAKNISEFGIFRVESGKAEDFKAIVSGYVEKKQQIYRAIDYFPEEVEKIDCATVKVFGNYVVYSFLNETDTEAFYNTIENLLKK